MKFTPQKSAMRALISRAVISVCVVAFAAHASLTLAAPVKPATESAKKSEPTKTAPIATPQSSAKLLPGDRCTGDPKFLEKIGFSKRALVDTTSTHRLGLQVTDIKPDGTRGRSTQHDSWRQAGFLGRVQRDRDGNIYVYPVPAVTLAFNPIEKSNILYRIESETGVMAPFVELPKAAPATEQNPFGLLALALDCEKHALYAASVFGSTASTENGVIARIDIATKEIKIVKRGIDALSLQVVFDERGKRLYVGTARENAVVSYGIAADGSLSEQDTVDINFSDVPAVQDKRPRVIRVDGRGRLYVRAIPFEYTLSARTTIPTTEMNFELVASAAREQKTSNSTDKRFKLIDQKSVDVSLMPTAVSSMPVPAASPTAAPAATPIPPVPTPAQK